MSFSVLGELRKQTTTTTTKKKNQTKKKKKKLDELPMSTIERFCLMRDSFVTKNQRKKIKFD